MKRSIVASLVSLLLSTLAAGAAAQDVKANAQAGERKAAMCTGCHSIPRYQASFPEVHKVPMLAGQNQAYMESALRAYRKGERRHPTMRAIAASLTDQDIGDLAAYYATLPHDMPSLADQPAHEPSAETAALLQKGNCAACHGANFSKPSDPAFPKLAGQYADYLYVALKSYRIHDNPQIGRTNAVMGGMAAPFTPAQLKQIADYIGSLPGQLTVVPPESFK